MNATLTCVSAASSLLPEQLGEAEVNGLAVLAGRSHSSATELEGWWKGFHWGPESQGGSAHACRNRLLRVYVPLLGSFQKWPSPRGWEDAQGNWHGVRVGGRAEPHDDCGNLDISPRSFARPV